MTISPETRASAIRAIGLLNKIIGDTEVVRRELRYSDGDNQALAAIQKIALNGVAEIHTMLNPPVLPTSGAVKILEATS